ncbi:hypothetical protein Tco_0519179 [Tanacetum coccineum]
MATCHLLSGATWPASRYRSHHRTSGQRWPPTVNGDCQRWSTVADHQSTTSGPPVNGGGQLDWVGHVESTCHHMAYIVASDEDYLPQ